MSRTTLKKGKKQFSILQIYTLSCLLFFALSIFNIYNFKVYDTWSFIVFYIYAGILWLGIKTGGSHFHIRFTSKSSTRNKKDRFSFLVSKQGQIIINIIFIASLLSFIYFLVLYRGSFNIASFGASLKSEYDEVARTKFESISSFILYGGSAVYLLVNGSKIRVSRFTLMMARICLFLPGLRGALLGRRFSLAVEVLIFFFVEYKIISNKYRNMNSIDKRAFRRIFLVSCVAVTIILYIFSQRIVYFPDTLFVVTPGDTELKPFWNEVYSQIDNKMNIFAYVSFYAGHSPYSFSYSYSNLSPDFPLYWGLQTCRVFIQIITNIFGLSSSYVEMSLQVPAIARYTGYAGQIITDFGKYLAPFISFLFGFIFGRIEKKRSTNSIYHSIYPIVQVWCVFAPVYYFTVGALDQVVFWTVILSLLCLKRKRL